MHRNALFEAVHNFSTFFHVFIHLSSFFSLSVMDINGYKTMGESHKHLFTSVNIIYS